MRGRKRKLPEDFVPLGWISSSSSDEQDQQHVVRQQVVHVGDQEHPGRVQQQVVHEGDQEHQGRVQQQGGGSQSDVRLGEHEHWDELQPQYDDANPDLEDPWDVLQPVEVDPGLNENLLLDDEEDGDVFMHDDNDFVPDDDEDVEFLPGPYDEQDLLPLYNELTQGEDIPQYDDDDEEESDG